MRTVQVFRNAKWIVICKILQSVIQLIIGMFSARYLGPSNYGLINYAASIVAFFMPIMKLGFDAILVNELLKKETDEGETLFTAITLNIFSSIFCIAGVTAFTLVANFDEPTTILVCILYSTSIFFAAFEMIQYWFQYKLLSKYSSFAILFAYIITSVYKVFLLASGKSVLWFALSHSVEYAIVGCLLLVLYLRIGKGRFRFSFLRAREMLSKSKYYIFSTLMVVIIQNIDHIMLTRMVGTAENGIYSAAITSASVVQFVYYAIIDSFRPLILYSKNSEPCAYERNVSRLYSIVCYLAFAQSIVFTVFAGLIIKVLYGAEYLGAAMVLQILTWYLAFSFMGSVRNIWLLAEEKQKLLPFINLFGALMNIVVNGILIPRFGAAGAAVASLLTQIFTNFILGFLWKPLKENNRLLIVALNPLFLLREIKVIFRELKKGE